MALSNVPFSMFREHKAAQQAAAANHHHYYPPPTPSRQFSGGQNLLEGQQQGFWTPHHDYTQAIEPAPSGQLNLGGVPDRERSPVKRLQFR